MCLILLGIVLLISYVTESPCPEEIAFLYSSLKKYLANSRAANFRSPGAVNTASVYVTSSPNGLVVTSI